MDKLVTAGLVTASDGSKKIDMAKYGAALAQEIRPSNIKKTKNEEGRGINVEIEFTDEDREKLLKISRVMGDINNGNLDLNEYIDSMTERQKLADKYGEPAISNPANLQPPMRYDDSHNKYANMAGMRIMGSGGFNTGFGSGFNGWGPQYSEDYSCLLYTKEEIESGKVPVSRVCYEGEEGYDEPNGVINNPKVKEEFHVCVMRQVKNDKGEYEKKYFGDEIAIEDAKREDAEAAAVGDFKAGALEEWRKKSLLDVYNLSDELRRYNSRLAEELLWYNSENEGGDAKDFEEFKQACMVKLYEYRSKDPLANIKSNTLFSGNQTHVLPPVSASQADFNEYLAELEGKYKAGKEMTIEEKEQAVIKKYQDDADRRYGGIKAEMDAIKTGKDCSSIIKRLQMLENINVCCTQEEYDREMEWMDQIKRNRTPSQEERRNTYGMYKMIMAWKKKDLPDGLTYDQWFDRWWNGPVEYLQKNSLKIQRIQASQRMVMRFSQIESSQPTPEQLKRQYEDAILRGFREYDHGKVNMNATLNEFFNGAYGFKYLMYCDRDQKLRKQRNSLRRLYDPERLHDLFRYNDPHRSPLLSPKPDYDELVNSKEYQERRRLFKEAIYKKNVLGALH